jgi:tetrahydrodipicolinate N-succinyltransferase
MNKQDILNNLEEVKNYIQEIESKKKKKVFAKADWGYIPTEINYDETMVLNSIKYHRHKNGGGWVSEKANVEETVWVGFFAIVHNGVLKDQCIIHDRAEINCNDLQKGAKANISDSARVYDSTWVYGSASVSGSARVYDSAWVYCSASVSDSARVYGSASVFGSASVSGSGYLKKSTSNDIELKDWETIK